MQAEDVVSFWRVAGRQKWFKKDAAFDHEFSEKFLDAHEAALRGKLNSWADDARGALALVILLDQFPRNAFRDSPRMFATDDMAVAVARKSVDAGFDQDTEEALRAFFYMPFMHSEQLADQDRCVGLTRPLGEDTLKFAQIHRDIIARFGRFPHRNKMLGRRAMPGEQEFLDQGGFAG